MNFAEIKYHFDKRDYNVKNLIECLLLSLTYKNEVSLVVSSWKKTVNTFIKNSDATHTEINTIADVIHETMRHVASDFYNLKKKYKELYAVMCPSQKTRDKTMYTDKLMQIRDAQLSQFQLAHRYLAFIEKQTHDINHDACDVMSNAVWP